MELNSTQEPVQKAEPHEVVPADIVGTVGKKTTIQLFVTTTKRLTDRKRGNDTYDDVINRDLDTIEKISAKPGQ